MTDGIRFCKKCFHPEDNHVGLVGCALDNCECPGWEHGETRVTSSTGASKGTKDARYDLIPVPALDALARLYGFGAKKYAEHNWRLGYEYSKSYAAAQRHMNAFWSGEDIDPETQIPHTICAAFHMFALTTYLTEHPEFDDRFENREPPQPSLQEVVMKAFDGMSSKMFMTRSDAREAALLSDLNIPQKEDDNAIETAAQWLADEPEGKTISFAEDFTDEQIGRVFDRAAEIKKNRQIDDRRDH